MAFFRLHVIHTDPLPAQSTCPLEASSVPLLERTLSIIDELPNPLPGVSEAEWAEFRGGYLTVD